MKLGIMQPYFFPHVEYYQLICRTDQWIILDNVQYIRHGWIERNRILKPKAGWQYIKVPLVKHHRQTPIKNILIRNKEPWREKIIAQLQHYKKTAPNFRRTMEVVKEALNITTSSIVELNRHVLKTTCAYLGIGFQSSTFSEMGLEIAPVQHPDEWALHISQSVGAKGYINARGGEALFRKEKYQANDIELSFMEANAGRYDQQRDFESGLSIIDAMMFNRQLDIR